MRSRFLVLAAIIVAAGCGDRERAARAAVVRGDDYLHSGRIAAAVIEYRNAVKQRPRWADAYSKLGDAYNAESESEEAYRAYSSAIDLDANAVHARVEAARLLLGAGRYSEALMRSEEVLERNEPQTAAAVISARALAEMNRTDEALVRLQTTIGIDPAAEAYAALGDVRLARGEPEAAEKAFRAGVQRAPTSVQAHIALARFLSTSGRAGEAENEYKAAVAVGTTSEAANRALASFYLGAARPRDAEPYLRAAAAQPNQQQRSTIALADYYLDAHRYDEARRVLEPVTSGPMAIDARVRLAAIAFRTGSLADAHKLLDRVLKKWPTAEAYTLNAQILQAENRTDEALAAAWEAVTLDPSAVVAQYIIGAIELDRGHYETAGTAFEAVMQERRWASAGALQMARVKLALGHPADAVALAETAGSDYDARLTLARSLIAAGQIARARVELQRLESMRPAAPQPVVLLGSLALTDGNLRDARAQAARALSLTPAGGDALILAARTSMAEADASSAERYLTRAVAGTTAPFDASAMLANLYAQRGDVARAQQILETYIAAHGDVAAPRTALGRLLQADNRPAEARAAYEQALALDPVEPVAANNLARLYVNEDAHVSRALELARTAASGLPNDASAHDTLGWIAFRAGQLSLAGAELERAVALSPREPLYKNHLRIIRIALDEAARANAAAEAEAARAKKAALSEQ